MTHSEGSIWFKAFPKIPRWYNEEVIITEKIDGTNACVAISEDLSVVSAQSRTRLLSIDKDNYGFALEFASLYHLLLLSFLSKNLASPCFFLRPAICPGTPCGVRSITGKYLFAFW